MMRNVCSSVRRVNSSRLFSSRAISQTAAKDILGLPDSFSAKELRQAYFRAVKVCHPDVQDDDTTTVDAAAQFRVVTEAYELLQDIGSDSDWLVDESVISLQEEEEYRLACRAWLGMEAEKVEESKRCPLFRQWLEGHTDSASHWRNFFSLHGGLAPKLKRLGGLLEDQQPKPVSETRRRRRR